MTSIESCTPLEAVWVDVLADEARRDLVFLWHITQGAFGGPMIPAPDLPSRLERIVAALLERGCSVGFGEPNSLAWTVPKELTLERREIPSAVVRLWLESPENYKFLVFALRDHRQ